MLKWFALGGVVVAVHFWAKGQRAAPGAGVVTSITTGLGAAFPQLGIAPPSTSPAAASGGCGCGCSGTSGGSMTDATNPLVTQPFAALCAQGAS